MHVSIKAFLLTTPLIVVAVGCDTYADKVKRDEAMASLKASRLEQDISQGPIAIRVFADPPGRDNRDPNGEYVTVSSTLATPTDIGGWTLCRGASLCFTFPPGAAIPANGSVRLHTGSGQTTATSFFMGHARAVWDNDHDLATLRDGETVVAQDIY